LNFDSKIGAVGTLSNSISGRQQIDTTYSNEDEYMEFAKTLMKKNKGKILPRRRLAGFAILIEKKLYDKIEVDTAFFKGNFPESCSLDAANIIEDVKDTKLINWKPIIPQTPLKADNIHEIHIDKTFKEKKYTHVRLNIFPDGGVSRLRVYGFI
jgi:allantoicase